MKSQKHRLNNIERSYKNGNVFLVAPLPPPYGGIANWTLLLSQYINDNETGIDLSIINTATKKRGVDGRNLWDIVIISGFEMVKILMELLKQVKTNKPDAIHITTSVKAGIIRDYIVIMICKIQY